MSEEQALPAAYCERFSAERVLGKGVSGRVFLAKSLSTGEAVALKIPLDEHNPIMRASLIEEIDNRLALQGPGVARISDWRSGAAPYVAMEVLRGNTIGSILTHTKKPYSLESAVDLALQWLTVSARMIALQRYTVDFHYNNAMFEQRPNETQRWRAVWTDLEKCFPTRGIGFFAHFPCPLRLVPPKMPLRGVYWGFNSRHTHRVMVELIISLCTLMRPRQRFYQARDERNGVIEPISLGRLERFLPSRVAHYLAERSVASAIPWDLSLRKIADEILDVTGCSGVVTLDPEENEDTQLWPSGIDAALAEGGACVVPKRFQFSHELHAWCEANETQRRSWIYVPTRASSQDVAGALSFDVLTLLYFQTQLCASEERKAARALLAEKLQAHAAWAWASRPYFAEKMNLPKPDVPFSWDPQACGDAIVAALGAWGPAGSVAVLAVENEALLSEHDRAALERVCERAKEARIAVLLGRAT